MNSFLEDQAKARGMTVSEMMAQRSAKADKSKTGFATWTPEKRKAAVEKSRLTRKAKKNAQEKSRLTGEAKKKHATND